MIGFVDPNVCANGQSDDSHLGQHDLTQFKASRSYASFSFLWSQENVTRQCLKCAINGIKVPSLLDALRFELEP